MQHDSVLKSYSNWYARALPRVQSSLRVFELLSRHQAALVDFQRSLEPSREQQLYLQRNQGELQALNKRIERLQVRAPSDARVRNILVTEGEVVAPGTALLQLQSDRPFEVQVFLDAKHRQLAQPGQRLKLQFPDGSWHDAMVECRTIVGGSLTDGDTFTLYDQPSRLAISRRNLGAITHSLAIG